MEPKDYLRAFLTKSGKTQQALADELGLRQTAVSSWLVGRKPIPMERALMLAKLYRELDAEKLCPNLREYMEGIEYIDANDRANPLAKRLQRIVDLLNQRGWSEVSEQNVVFKIERIVDEHVKMAERLKEIHKLSAV